MLKIEVMGIPGPQGSKRHLGKGVMVEMSKKVKPWREAVKWAALDAMQRNADYPEGVTGPVRIEITFFMPRPKSAKDGAVPSTRPDLSKLIRSTEDALTDIGAYEDDGRIVQLVANKMYTYTGRTAGATIYIGRLA